MLKIRQTNVQRRDLHAGRARAGRREEGADERWRRSPATMKWHAQERGPEGLRRVVRNGQAPAWRIACGMGPWKCRGRGYDRRVDEHGERCRLASRILSSLAESRGVLRGVLLVRHLRGLSKGDVRPVLETLLGEDGLSATNIGRLTAVCSMLGGVAAVSQAQPGWMRVRVRVGEGGAIRCWSQTELTLPRLSIWFTPTTHETNCRDYPSAKHWTAIATRQV
jgi:hypothetical protein